MSNPNELLHTQLLAKHPNKPMKVLWEALIDEKVASCEVVMAIVNDPRCGIERRTEAADGAIRYPDFDFALHGGATPLMLAALAGRDDVLEALLTLNAAVDAKEDKYGYTALHIAALTDNSAAIEMLIAKGSNVNTISNDGWTPLHEAVGNGKLEAVKMLIVNGSVNAVDKYGRTAFHLAVSYDELEAVKLLITYSDVNAVDNDGSTPLHLGARNAPYVTELLLSCGSHVNAVDDEGYSPLHWAVRYDNHEAIKLLIDSGSHVNATDNDGNTPLHWAAGNGNTEVQKALIAEGSGCCEVSDTLGSSDTCSSQKWLPPNTLY